MKIISVIMSIIIFTTIFSISTAQNGNNSNINFINDSNGSVFNYSYNGKVVIQSIQMYPEHYGYWINNGNVYKFVSNNIKIELLNFNSPVINIFGTGPITISIIFESNLTKAISFNGFFINNFNGIVFIRGGIYYINGSELIFNSRGFFSIKIILENTITFGKFSIYMQTNYLEGILFLNNGNYTYEIINENFSIGYVKFQHESLSLILNLNGTKGFFFIVSKTDFIKNIIVNNQNFKMSNISNISQGQTGTFAYNYTNGSYVYLLYLNGEESINQGMNKPFILNLIFISIILIIILAGAVTVLRVIKK